MAFLSFSSLGINISYVAITVLPPVLWLLFYLREDRHPEPKGLLIMTFLGGMAAAIVAIFGECVFVQVASGGSCGAESTLPALNPWVLFAGIALIEEYVKYLAVKFLVLKRSNFDEPVDAMIYMMTVAMGFAVLENILFVLPVFYDSILQAQHIAVASGLQIIANRFIGANLLHALASSTVGFFLARAWFHPRRHHFIALGIIIAAGLHTLFDYFIVIRGVRHEATWYLILLLTFMAVMVFIDFERLKRQPPAS